jgi:hypothetical protein
VVDRGKGGELGEELFQEDGREAGDGGGDGWFLGKDDVLAEVSKWGFGRVAGRG